MTMKAGARHWSEGSVVRLGPLDLALLAALHAECFPEDPWDAGACAKILAMPGTAGWLAIDARRQPIGFILLRAVCDEAEVLSLGVRPVMRRRGVAERLLAEAVESLSATAVTELFLEVAADNRAAQAFYAHAGFRPVGRRAAYYRRQQGGAVDALLLRLELGYSTAHTQV